MTHDIGDVDPKDPSEAKFYAINVAPYLNSGATVSSATPTCPGLTFNGTSTTDTTAVTKISGGQDEQDYAVRWEIGTSDGETLVLVGRLKVRRADVPRTR